MDADFTLELLAAHPAAAGAPGIRGLLPIELALEMDAPAHVLGALVVAESPSGGSGRNGAPSSAQVLSAAAARLNEALTFAEAASQD